MGITCIGQGATNNRRRKACAQGITQNSQPAQGGEGVECRVGPGAGLIDKTRQGAGAWASSMGRVQGRGRSSEVPLKRHWGPGTGAVLQMAVYESRRQVGSGLCVLFVGEKALVLRLLQIH